MTTFFKMINFISIVVFVDAVQCICSGILRGSGNQAIGAVTNVVSFYVIGLPMAWILCYDWMMGVPGLLIGLYFGAVFQAVVLFIAVFWFEDRVFVVTPPRLAESTGHATSATRISGGSSGGSAGSVALSEHSRLIEIAETYPQSSHV